MNTNKNGFTLVEVLAVIIVLGVIGALIIPKVVQTIRDSKANSHILSVNGLIEVFNGVVMDKKASLIPFSGCFYDFDGNVTDCGEIDYKGKFPDSGNVTIDSDGNVSGTVIFGDDKFIIEDNIVYSDDEYYEVFPDRYVFDYTGSVQSFSAPRTGYYKVELWGAQGNDADNSRSSGGLGSYVSGVINLNENDNLYVYVGQHRSDRNDSFNCGSTGGGESDLANNGGVNGYGGGGATDIRLVSGAWDNAASLASRIMVAAGGGGATNYAYAVDGGIGGTFVGGSGYNGKYPSNGSVNTPPTGGTQTTGGTSTVTSHSGSVGTFGKGGNGHYDWGSGGGGGYYGGSGGGYSDYSVDSGAGGSSYISGYTGCVAITSESNTSPKTGCANNTSDNSCSVHYSERVFLNGVMKSGAESMPSYDGKSTMVGNSGNGYAVISYAGKTIN